LRVNRQNRRTFAKDARVPSLVRSPSDKDQNAALAQAKRASAQRRHEVRIRIEDDHANPSRQTPHEALPKMSLVPSAKALRNKPKQRSRHHHGIDVALVIRAE